MANIWEKSITMLAGNLNSGLSYLITTVTHAIFYKCVLLSSTIRRRIWNCFAQIKFNMVGFKYWILVNKTVHLKYKQEKVSNMLWPEQADNCVLVEKFALQFRSILLKFVVLLYHNKVLIVDLTTFQILGQNLSNFFVGILVQTMTLKGHFEINWPLQVSTLAL